GGGAFGAFRGRRKRQNNEEQNEEAGKDKPQGKTKRVAKEATKEVAKEGAKQGLRALGKALAPYTAGISIVAAEGIIHWRISLILIAILFLFFFMMFDTTTFDPPPQDNTPTTSDTCNPQKASFGQTSVCTITVTYNGSADDIVITDTILPGTDFVSADHKGTYDKASQTITWDAKQLNLPLNPVNITVTVTVRVTTHQNNTIVYNAYDINPTGLTSGSGSGGGAAIPGNLPPSSNTCSGIYSYYMSITPGHQNYGDPTCTLVKKDPNGVAIINKDAILTELKTLKSSEAMGWFICVIPNESSYNANAYLGASTSGKGAYGLVQMNPTGAGNGKYDNGQVVWPLQLSNGINYNDKVIGHSFSYWPTSYDPCLRSNGVSVP
ncbi:MAG TPA: hypothetical protein VNZ45_10925, partial [Bacteroidia bacterium]|nr:hypothetical protein [Bacteroidia bacterium]